MGKKATVLWHYFVPKLRQSSTPDNTSLSSRNRWLDRLEEHIDKVAKSVTLYVCHKRSYHSIHIYCIASSQYTSSIIHELYARKLKRSGGSKVTSNHHVKGDNTKQSKSISSEFHHSINQVKDLSVHFQHHNNLYHDSVVWKTKGASWRPLELQHVAFTTREFGIR